MLKIDIVTYIPILRISPRHHAIEPGFPMAGCYAGNQFSPVRAKRCGLSLSRV